jgi:hypothetical protein
LGIGQRGGFGAAAGAAADDDGAADGAALIEAMSLIPRTALLKSFALSSSASNPSSALVTVFVIVLPVSSAVFPSRRRLFFSASPPLNWLATAAISAMAACIAIIPAMKPGSMGSVCVATVLPR